jgi:hypothetical protein
MLVNLLGVFFWSLVDRNGAILKPLKGGKLLSIFCWLLADRSVRFLPLKQGEMLVNFFVGVCWFPFGSKMHLSDAKLD